MDRRISPCEDFYQFACGGWIRTHAIPPDRSAWDRYYQLAEQNAQAVHEILEQAAHQPKSPVEKQVGDYYAACMDETAVNGKGMEPLKAELARIAGIQDRDGLAKEVARLHPWGVDALFSFYSTQDYKDSEQVIAEIDQGGLGLPDREYYRRDDRKSEELRQAYEKHVARMFELVGHGKQVAEGEARAVREVETALASAEMERVQHHDASLTYHKMSTGELAQAAPDFAWETYFQATGAPSFGTLNVVAPDFFRSMNGLAARDLSKVRTYLAWHLIHSAAPLLPQPLVEEDFDFFQRTLRGATSLSPRWKRCTALSNRDLGEAIGRIYVDAHFSAQQKGRVLGMVRALQDGFASEVNEVTWLEPQTRREASRKVQELTVKIGYPDRWRDYSQFHVERSDALGNALRGQEFEFRSQLAKIGKGVDRGEWFSLPQEVDGYHTDQLNEIVFTAGILQPPLFDGQADDAANFGAIGRVIGHELVHGFDSQGRKFDQHGNLRDWWTGRDVAEYELRARCFVEEYSNFKVADDVKLNGELGLRENIADNGGLRLSFAALEKSSGGREVSVGGLTPEQRYFLAFAQSQCANVSEKTERVRVATDPHSPARFRVNGSVSNMEEFQKAFACRAGDAMAPEKRCRIW